MDIAREIANSLSVDPCTPLRVYGVLKVMEGADPVDGLRVLEHLAAMWRTKVDEKLTADASRIVGDVVEVGPLAFVVESEVEGMTREEFDREFRRLQRLQEYALEHDSIVTTEIEMVGGSLALTVVSEYHRIGDAMAGIYGPFVPVGAYQAEGETIRTQSELRNWLGY